MPPFINVDNPWELVLVLVISLAWATREIRQRSAKMEQSPPSNNFEAKIRAAIAEHAIGCPAAYRLERDLSALRLGLAAEINAMRTSIDRLYNILVERKLD